MEGGCTDAPAAATADNVDHRGIKKRQICEIILHGVTECTLGFASKESLQLGIVHENGAQK